MLPIELLRAVKWPVIVIVIGVVAGASHVMDSLYRNNYLKLLCDPHVIQMYSDAP